MNLCWVSAHIITGIFRFGIVKDKTTLKNFILIDLIGTYVMMLVCAGFSCLIYFIVKI